VVAGFDISPDGPVVSTGRVAFPVFVPLVVPLVMSPARLGFDIAPALVVSVVPLVPACAPPWLWLGCAKAAELIKVIAPINKSFFISLSLKNAVSV
jgi:hypothetical protein